MLESKVETYFKNQITALGGIAFKFKSTVNGVPDQIAMLDGHSHFVELKRPGAKPRADQVSIQKKIQAQGIPVYNISTLNEVDDFIINVLKRTPQPLNTSKKKNKAVTIRSASVFDIKEED